MTRWQCNCRLALFATSLFPLPSHSCCVCCWAKTIVFDPPTVPCLQPIYIMQRFFRPCAELFLPFDCEEKSVNIHISYTCSDLRNKWVRQGHAATLQENKMFTWCNRSVLMSSIVQDKERQDSVETYFLKGRRSQGTAPLSEMFLCNWGD